jgi:hypothetical protein
MMREGTTRRDNNEEKTNKYISRKKLANQSEFGF